jgi:fructose-1,6-bisphosphatase/inositol monophosphatase family enzyme
LAAAVLGKDASVEQEAFLAAEVWGQHALRIARDARSQAGIAIETKRDDFDLKTPADKQIERWLVDVIRLRFAGHAILGEEGGEVSGVEPWRWVIDPIDGTFNLATGLPEVHVLVGEKEEVDAFGPVVAELARSWEPSTARLVPISSG